MSVNTTNLLVWIRNQLDVTFVLSLFLLYKNLNMFRVTMCPSSGADDCVVLSPRVGIVQWLQEDLPAATAFWKGKLNRGDNLDNLGIDVRMIL